MSKSVATRYFGSNGQNYYRSAIALFFGSTTTQQPLWLSVLEEVGGHSDSSLHALFGLSFDLYIRICLKAGLVSQKMYQVRTIFTLNTSEWDVMITECNLKMHINSINITKISGKRYYFINIGTRTREFHKPEDQFNGRVHMPSIQAFLRHSRASLRDVLEVEDRESSVTILSDNEEEEEAEAYEEEITKEKAVKAETVPNFLLEKHFSCQIDLLY